MRDLLEVMRERRSIRSYEERDVPVESIARILEAGGWAPSAMNHQPLRYMVVTDRGLIADLSSRTVACAARVARWLPLLRLFVGALRDKDLAAKLRERGASKSGDPIFYRAPLLILALADRREYQAPTDLGCAAQNMMLEASAAGLGSCFIGFASLLNSDRRALRLLEVPVGFRILAGIVFGYPRAVPKAPERRGDFIINRIGQ